MNNYYDDSTMNKSSFGKKTNNLYDNFQGYDERTRDSAYSKNSEAREDLTKSVMSMYEKAFVQDN